MPLMNIAEEKFEQPIFGSNFLAGNLKPLYNLLPGDTKFKLWFTSGGCTAFLSCFSVVRLKINRSFLKSEGLKEEIKNLLNM